jgi:hypothetical protein
MSSKGIREENGVSSLTQMLVTIEISLIKGSQLRSQVEPSIRLIEKASF